MLRSISLAAGLCLCAALSNAQDLIGFDASQFGQVILSRKQVAAGDIVPEAAFGLYQNEFISTYSPNSIFAVIGRSVGRLDVLTDKGLFPCTAFLVADDLLMTNHHCVPGVLDNRDIGATSLVAVQFLLGYVREGVAGDITRFNVNPTPVETSEDLDYSLLRIIGKLPGKDFAPLRLAALTPHDNDPFWIIGHPAGEAQRISREQCRANTPALSDGKLLHTCDTLPGNSGSPVIDAATQMVVGLHNAGSSYNAVNYGIPMVRILEQSQVLKATEDAGPDLEALALSALGDALGLADTAARAAALNQLAKAHPGTRAATTANQLFAALSAPPPAKPAPAVSPPPKPADATSEDDRVIAEAEATALRIASELSMDECDRLASAPEHPDKAAGLMTQAGIRIADISAPEAIAACTRALEYFPDHPRLTAATGRAYIAAEKYENSMTAFRAAADQGDVLAMNGLGYLYSEGLGVEESDETAAEWFKRAAELGFSVAQANLSSVYSRGAGVAKSDRDAFKWGLLSAEQGFGPAMYYVASAYLNGRGVARSDTEAAKWARKGADAGDSAAQYLLGFLYMNGRGVTAAQGLGVDWYLKAAAQGNSNAQANLGVFYLNTDGPWQSDTEAAKWLRLAAEQSHALAQSNLAFLYKNGRGVAQSDEIAAEWYLKAAEQEDLNAQFAIGMMYLTGQGVSQSDKIGADWMRKAAWKDHDIAQYNIGLLYETGRGTTRSDTEAANWYAKSAAQGHGLAQFASARLHDVGKGAARDPEKAADLYIQAARSGHADLPDWRIQSKDTVRALQKRLAELGHYKGGIDGQFGAKTRAALDALKPTP